MSAGGSKAKPTPIERRKLQIDHDSPLIQLSKAIARSPAGDQSDGATPPRVGVQYPERPTGDEARGCTLLKDRCTSRKVQASMKKGMRRNVIASASTHIFTLPFTASNILPSFKKHRADFTKIL